MSTSTIQHIIDTGEVSEEIDTPTLQEANAWLEEIIRGFRESTQLGLFAETAIVKYETTQERILEILNQRHGLDGMTHLNSHTNESSHHQC